MVGEKTSGVEMGSQVGKNMVVVRNLHPRWHA